MSEFKISQEFQMFRDQSQTAFKEAGEAEMGAGRQIDLPIGTRGTCKFAGATAGKSQPKVQNGQQIPGKPYIRMEFEVQTPESHRGRKYGRYFDLSHHENYPMTQKIQDWWDYMQNAGCPREVRATGDPAQAFTWAQNAPAFDFLIVPGYQGRAEIDAVPPLGPMPTASATQAAMQANVPFPQQQGGVTAPQPQPQPGLQVPTNLGQPAPAPQPAPGVAPTAAPASPGAPSGPSAPGAPGAPGFTPNQKVTAFGQEYIFKSSEGNFCTLINPATGVEMPQVHIAAVQPA